jgi:hypothetical protein
LDIPIRRGRARTQYRSPVQTISPTVDGRVTDYFEWLAAGSAAPVAGDPMQRSERCVEQVFFGYDQRRFYLRIDLTEEWLRGIIPGGHSLQIQLVSPREFLVTLEFDQARKWQCRVLRSAVEGFAPEFAGARILELAVSLEELGVNKPEDVRFSVSIFDKGRELERLPTHGFLSVTVDPWELDHREWLI